MFYDQLTGWQRTFWRWAFLIIVLFMLSDLGLHANSIFDRRQTKRIQAQIIEKEAQNRRMLDARARIQIALVKTGTRRNAFTDEEKSQISEMWQQAEYDLIEPNIFRK